MRKLRTKHVGTEPSLRTVKIIKNILKVINFMYYTGRKDSYILHHPAVATGPLLGPSGNSLKFPPHKSEPAFLL